MADDDKELSELDAVSSVGSGDSIYLVQDGVSKRGSVDLLAEYVNSAIAVNLKDEAPLVGDGTTDNIAAMASIQTTRYGRSFPNTITVTVATPAVFTRVGHGLRPMDAVVFSTTGTLPTGLVVGTTYYVITAGLTSDVFRVSTFDALLSLAGDGLGDGAAVATSGSQSGVHSFVVLGSEAVNFLLPAGAYHFDGFGNFPTANRRSKVSGYGTVVDHLNLSTFGLASLTEWATRGTFFAKIASASIDAASVTLIDLADVSKFPVNCWVCVAALDVQNAVGFDGSFPPNNHYFEFKKITAVDAGTGVISLDGRLINSYKSTYPEFYEGVGNIPNGGGSATLYLMSPNWDQEFEASGIHTTEFFQTIFQCRSVKLVDWIFDGQPPAPGVVKKFVFERCLFDNLSDPVELDKMGEQVDFIDCSGHEVRAQSTSIDRLTFKGVDFDIINGTAKNTAVRDSMAGRLFLGPLSFGVSESVLLENSRFASIAASPRLDAPLGASALLNLVSRFTFSNGTLKVPIDTAPNSWAVPGRAMFVSDAAGVNQNMGCPFKIGDVYEDAGDFCIDTTLEAMPVGSSTSSTVTITIASPAVVTWASHGLTANTPVLFLTTGALPTGITTGTVYYVIAAGLAAGSFRFSTSVGGAAVNTSGTQSGTHTGVGNPLQFVPHPCQNITAHGITGCALAVDLSCAPDGLPLFSYAKREYAGFIESNPVFAARAQLWGNLVECRINVRRPYTGADTPVRLNISANAFDDDLLPDNLSFTIDLLTAGERIVTPADVVGEVVGDTLAAFGSWITGEVSVTVTDTHTGFLHQQPLVEIEWRTDQGVTGSRLLHFYGPTSVHGKVVADTTTDL